MTLSLEETLKPLREQSKLHKDAILALLWILIYVCANSLDTSFKEPLEKKRLVFAGLLKLKWTILLSI